MKADYIDHMGTDLTVVNAARVSFNAESTELSQKDKGLIQFLARGCMKKDWDVLIDDIWDLTPEKERADIEATLKHVKNMPTHWTPFSHAMITIRETVPIFVARQRFKHVVGFTYNEVSRRYVDDTPEFHVPEIWRVRPEGNIKQGSGTSKLPAPEFVKGFCASCGKETTQNIRAQGGGRTKKYCSDVCKYHYTNRNRNPYKACFSNAEARVKREGKREWSLDFDTFDFPEYCPYLGIKLDYSLGKGKIQPNSPSYDRIDPTKDYIPGNVEIISNRANSMKSDASREEQIKMAEHVLLKYKGCVPSKSNTYEGLLESAKDLYENMIQDGYSPEQARMVLPQSMLTTYWVTGSLYAWANAYIQRSDSHAQKEIQDLAAQWDAIIRPLYPVSWEALVG